MEEEVAEEEREEEEVAKVEIADEEDCKAEDAEDACKVGTAPAAAATEMAVPVETELVTAAGAAVEVLILLTC